MLAAVNAVIVTTIEAAKGLLAASVVSIQADFYHIVSRVPKRGSKMQEGLQLQL